MSLWGLLCLVSLSENSTLCLVAVRDPNADEHTLGEAADALRKLGRTDDLLALAHDPKLSSLTCFVATEAHADLERTN